VIQILVAGFIAGTVDIGAAALIYSLSPEDILRSIAGGLLGVAALRAGMAVAGMGLLLQWAMSIIIAAIYAAVANFLSVLKRHWWRGLRYRGLSRDELRRCSAICLASPTALHTAAAQRERGSYAAFWADCRLLHSDGDPVAFNVAPMGPIRVLL
jgi:hypothetical protein